MLNSCNQRSGQPRALPASPAPLQRLAPTTEVEWRPTPGYPSYEVSNFGEVRRARSFRHYAAGMVLAQKRNAFGYKTVVLYCDRRRGYFTVHRLVARAFLGEPPSKRHQVAHNDGNPANNHLLNLRWATPSENNMDRALHGTVPDRKGERHPLAKLNDQLVLELREQRHRGCTYPELAQRYGIPKLTVYDAVVGTTWPHLPGAVGARRQAKTAFGNCK